MGRLISSTLIVLSLALHLIDQESIVNRKYLNTDSTVLGKSVDVFTNLSVTEMITASAISGDRRVRSVPLLPRGQRRRLGTHPRVRVRPRHLYLHHRVRQGKWTHQPSNGFLD